MSLPLVTIGAVNYNNAADVIETLNSIKEQTFANVELIVVDDCSTDNSPDLIRDWLKTYDKPHRFIVHEENRGVAAGLNDILNNANGKYISEMATDDVLMPDKIRIQVEILENAEEDVCGVYSDAYIIDEQGRVKDEMFLRKGKLQVPPSGNIYENMLMGELWFHTGTMLVKTDCYRNVGLYDQNILSEDVDILLKLTRQYKFIYSSYVSEKYRVRGNSLTRLNTWYTSQIQVFAKNIPYSKIAIKRMDAAAASAYIENDGKALAILPQYKNQSAYIKCIILLRRINAPKIIGRVILFGLRKYLEVFRTIVG